MQTDRVHFWVTFGICCAFVIYTGFGAYLTQRQHEKIGQLESENRSSYNQGLLEGFRLGAKMRNLDDLTLMELDSFLEGNFVDSPSITQK